MVVLSLALLSAAPSMRAPSRADLTVFVPRLERLDGIGAFSSRAGERSVMLRVDSWAGEFHPLLYLDPTRADSLKSAGIDPSGEATLAWIGDGKWSCVPLSDAALFQSRADGRLSALGVVAKKSQDGVSLFTASVEGAVRAGYALKGKTACAFSHPNPGQAQALASEAIKRAARGAAIPAAPPGVAVAWSKSGSWAIDANATAATLRGHTNRFPLPPLRPEGDSPYASLTPSGLFFARARVEPSALPSLLGWMESQVAALCPACNRPELSSLAQTLAPLLTGNVLLRVDRMEVRESLRTAAGRYFSLKHAYLAEVSDPAAVAALLPRVTAQKGARADAGTYTLAVPGGEIQFGLHGSHLYVANDDAALRAALSGLSGKRGRLAHGAEAWLDPPLAAKALRQITLFDVMSSQELASVFAAGTDLGPLLGITQSVSGWADGSGEMKGEMTWALSPTDAGR